LTRLSVQPREGILIAHVAGEIDAATTRDLRDAIAGRLTNVGPGLVLDLSDATYLDSAGIEFIFDLARRLRTHGQLLRLVVPAKAPMRRVLDLSHIEQVTEVDTTVEAATDGFRDALMDERA
jgi:anti-sigma B factor antagonist